MKTDRYTITFLIQRTDAPDLSGEEGAELQEAHLCHLADLAEEGHLLATGAVPDDVVRGLSIFDVDPQRACERGKPTRPCGRACTRCGRFPGSRPPERAASHRLR